MKENFDAALGFTLRFEGGYVNHPKDPGGHTNKGITLTTMRRYKPGATVADLKAIPDSLVARIYRVGYWNVVSGDTLASGVDAAVFDYGVNSGPPAAKKSLMKVIGGSDIQTIKKLCARRLSIYRGFRHWSTFGKGWTRRVTALEAFAVKLAVAAKHEPHDVKQVLEDEADAAKATAKKQAAGGAAAGGSTIAPVGADNLDQLPVLILGIIVVAAIGVAAYLIWRATVNNRRAEAYRKEADL